MMEPRVRADHSDAHAMLIELEAFRSLSLSAETERES